MKIFLLQRLSFLCFFLLFFSIGVKAQLLPAIYNPGSVKLNYVRTFEVLAPGINAAAVEAQTRRDVRQTTNYVDGLGLVLQTVIKEGSLETPTNFKADLVVPNLYDGFGREEYKFLPFASTANNNSRNNGNFKYDAFQQQAIFSTTQYPGETFFYSKTNFEASPLNRVTDAYAPGNSWVGSEGNTNITERRNVQTKYWINTSADDVKIWNVTSTPDASGIFNAIPTPTLVYAAGELYKNVTIDEHKKQVIEFKDKEGKVILKKVQLTAPDDGTGSGHNGWLCTYYIYDDLGNLSCVIQPRGVELLKNNLNWDINYGSGEILQEQCFRYRYDQRNRLIVKKVPGAAEVFMFYDARDRMVMTQDGNLRLQNKWMITLYDELNRPVQTGLLLNTWDNKTADQHFSAASTSTAYPFSVSTVPASAYWEMLTTTNYDYYGAFDSYKSFTSSSNITNNIYAVNNNINYAQPLTQSLATKGMVTYTQTKILGTADNYITTLLVYDDKGRVIQTKTLNQNSTVDINTVQYSWNGVPLVSIQELEGNKHVIVTKTEYDDLWRVANVKKSVSSTINGVTVNKAQQVILQNQYNALGQIINKKLGNKNGTVDGTVPLAKQNFEYNIRGWLLSVNKNYLTGSTNADEYFGMQLGYDKDGALGSFATNGEYNFNGNITGTLWKSEGDKEKRKYNFKYDAVNRLAKADFTQYESGAGNTATFGIAAGINFSMGGNPGNGGSMQYDANGNIKEMWQTGLLLNSSAVIDKLNYTYINAGGTEYSNKLLKLTDGTTAADNGKLGDFKDGTNTTDDYSYDVNGNLILDNNKAISNITYNYLNLPSIITVAQKGTITYTYDAAGTKLKKQTLETPTAANGNKTITTTTTYLNGMVYESKTTTPTNNPNTDYTDKLQFMGQEEGRIRALYANTQLPNTLTGLAYDYMLKDHLGNVRVVLTDEVQQDKYPVASLEDAKITTEQNYYDINTAQVVPKSEATGITNYINDNGIGNNPGDPTFGATNSAKLYKLNSNTAKTGLGITLKVMAGDRVDVFGNSYYFENKQPEDVNNNVPVADLLASFLSAASGSIASGMHGGVTVSQINTNAGVAGINSMINDQNSQSSTTKPRAFINVIFFDEQFKSYDYKLSPIGNAGTVKANHHDDLQSLMANKNGYVYIYCSNESPVNVFFDNLQVTHTRSPLLEESSYYMYGLRMEGICSKAAGIMQNKDKTFQGQKFDDDLGINYYSFKWRNHDPQIGRFIEIDPLAEDYEYNSTYAFSENKVTNHVELEGLEAVSAGSVQSWLGTGFGQLTEAVGRGVDYISNFFTKSETEVSRPSSVTGASTVFTTTSTTEYGSNVLGWIQNSKSPDATVSNGPSIFKADTKTDFKVELKQEVKTNQATLSTKTALNGSSVETKVETNVKIKNVPVKVGVSNSQNFSTGENKTKVKAGIGSSTNQAYGQVEVTNTGNKTSTSVSVGVEEKTNNVKKSFSIGKSF